MVMMMMMNGDDDDDDDDGDNDGDDDDRSYVVDNNLQDSVIVTHSTHLKHPFNPNPLVQFQAPKSKKHLDFSQTFGIIWPPPWTCWTFGLLVD